ncbi:unnamed protein product [Withania somnifera]
MKDPVYFERYEVHGNMKCMPEEVMDSIKKNKVCLEGGLMTPVGGGVSSSNVQMRKELHFMPDVNKRKKVTAVHKANVMKLADGLFLESCREVAAKYPEIQYEEIIVDNCCMQIVSKPKQFDVMVTPNLYGNLIANITAGLAGGTGVMLGGNFGADQEFFEQGASAGNVGNERILKHLEFPSFADRLETAIRRVIAEGKFRTKDVGGDSTTQEIVDAIIAALD